MLNKVGSQIPPLCCCGQGAYSWLLTRLAKECNILECTCTIFCYYMSLLLFSKMTCFSLSSQMSKRKDEVAQAEKGKVVKHLHSFCWNVRNHFSSAFHLLYCGSQGKNKVKCQLALLGKTDCFISLF